MTNERWYAVIEARGLLSLEGEDARDFLQGLISNDIGKVSSKQAIYATLLTPQGKFLHDFFIAEWDGALLFDCERARRDDLVRRLAFYRLRARVEVTPRDDLAVLALYGDRAGAALGLDDAQRRARPFAGGVVFIDPRLAAAGARAILPVDEAREAAEAAGFAPKDAADYDRHRLALALPDGSRDIRVEKSILAEIGIEGLNGLDFEKGCFVGQEVTARSYHRASLRKRLFGVEIDGPTPAPDAPVTLAGRAAGEMRSAAGERGLAVLRLDRVAEAAEADSEPLRAGDARLRPVKPPWARF